FIETGTQHSIDNVMATLDQLNIHPSQVKYVIPTHIHLDHAGGASKMMQQFDQARLIIHPRGARHMIDPGRLIEGSIEVYGETAFRQLYGDIEAIEQKRIDIANDLDRYRLGSRELLFIDTPGHARHHFCIFDETSRGIFSGDTFGVAYPALKQYACGLIPSTPPTQFDPDALLKSIDRLLEYRPHWMYLTHFGAIDNPERYAGDFRLWISDYIELSERIEPRDAKSTLRLESALKEMILSRLTDSDPGAGHLMPLLENDIRLNAQGIALWWRTTHMDEQPGNHAPQ
ncbi:MAG: MBL fold metallo-hydrolase, partial [Gammaproteobacteria bacterium]